MPVALVWGAAGGIGSAVVDHLAANHWTVGAVSRRPLAPVQPEIHAFTADVADEFSVQQAVFAAAQELPPVDLWIYAAGDITSSKVSDMDAAGWRRIMDANLNGAFLTTHASLPLLADTAHLIYVGAVSERLQLPGLSAYAAAKAGLEAMAAVLAKEERQRRVTVVRPGAVATPLWNKMPLRLPRSAATPAQLAQQILAIYVDGRTGAVDL